MSDTEPGQMPSSQRTAQARPLPPLMDLLAAGAVILPAYGLPLLLSLRSAEGRFADVNIQALLLTALATTIFLCGYILSLQVFVMGKPLRALQPGSQSLVADLRDGLLVTLLLLVAVFAFGLAAKVFFHLDTGKALAEIAGALSRDRLLLLVFLGPVIWLQAALTEELTRVFLLSRLSRVWPGGQAAQLSLLAISFCFGLGHLYQGWIGVIGTTMIGYILGSYYQQKGRILPMILAHGVYDTISVLALVNLAQSGQLAML